VVTSLAEDVVGFPELQDLPKLLDLLSKAFTRML
jgi:hypothetical protein